MTTRKSSRLAAPYRPKRAYVGDIVIHHGARASVVGSRRADASDQVQLRFDHGPPTMRYLPRVVVVGGNATVPLCEPGWLSEVKFRLNLGLSVNINPLPELVGQSCFRSDAIRIAKTRAMGNDAVADRDIAKGERLVDGPVVTVYGRNLAALAFVVMAHPHLCEHLCTSVTECGQEMPFDEDEIGRMTLSNKEINFAAFRRAWGQVNANIFLGCVDKDDVGIRIGAHQPVSLVPHAAIFNSCAAEDSNLRYDLTNPRAWFALRDIGKDEPLRWNYYPIEDDAQYRPRKSRRRR